MNSWNCCWETRAKKLTAGDRWRSWLRHRPDEFIELLLEEESKRNDSDRSSSPSEQRSWLRRRRDEFMELLLEEESERNDSDRSSSPSEQQVLLRLLTTGEG